MDDIGIIGYTIDDEKDEDIEELAMAINQFINAKPQIQRAKLDEETVQNDNKKKAMAAYIKAKKEGKKIEFDKRVKAQEFRNSMRKGVGNMQVDRKLSNKPNKKR